MLTLEEKQRVENQAAADLVKKLRLERTFIPEITALFNKIVSDCRTSLLATGYPVSAKDYNGRWNDLLNKQYQRCGREFSGSVLEFNKKSFADIETKQEDEEIDQSALLSMYLLTLRNQQAMQQSDIITSTNDKEISQSVNDARQDLINRGEIVNNTTLAAAVAVVLRRKYMARRTVIATSETQWGVESTKFAEGLALDEALEPDPVSGNVVVRQKPESTVKKTWRTIGDSKVRESHSAANFQTRRLQEPYIVGGEQLMFPRDNSLGAAFKELVNCRCSSVISA